MPVEMFLRAICAADQGSRSIFYNSGDYALLNLCREGVMGDEEQDCHEKRGNAPDTYMQCGEVFYRHDFLRIRPLRDRLENRHTAAAARRDPRVGRSGSDGCA
jgi:hypothetical protein